MPECSIAPHTAGEPTIAPLRKRCSTGEVCTRRPETEARLRELLVVNRGELVRRCQIMTRTDPEYVSSECLLYFVRASRNDPTSEGFAELYRALAERIKRALPREETAIGTLYLRNADLRDHVFDRFVALLAQDRHAYAERLDFFEVRFDMTLRSLRLDALRRLKPTEGAETLDDADSAGELTKEVEEAAGSMDSFSKSELSKKDCRSALDAAVDKLPTLQQRIIELWKKDIPFHSENPEVRTVAKILNKSDRHVRTLFHKACAKLRKTISQGAQP